MMTRKFNQLLVSLGVTITLLASAYPQASRTVMVQSNSGVLLFPTNLFTANAPSARSGLSLATHATNPIVPVTSGGSGATNAATARTNFGLVWSGLTNSSAAGFRSALGVPLAALTNTNADTFRGDIGLGATWLTNTNADTFRGDIGLGWSALTNTNATNFCSAIGLGATWLTNTNATNFRTGVGLGSSSAVTFREVSASEGFGGPTNGKGFLVSQGGGIRSTTNSLYSSSPEIEFMAYAVNEVGRFVSNGIVFTAENSSLRFGTNNTNGSAITRTNLGLGATWLTNSSATSFRSAIELGATNNVSFNSLAVTNTALTRTNIGLGWSALTNTNSATSLLGFNSTNGQIVAATNMVWTNAFDFSTTTVAAQVRTNLGFGSTNNVEFNQIRAESIIFPKTGAPLVSIETFSGSLSVTMGGLTISPSPQTVGILSGYKLEIGSGAYLNFTESASISNVPTINFANTTNAAQTRTNLALGATNNVEFSNVRIGSLNTGGGSDSGFLGRSAGGDVSLRGTNVTSATPAFFGWSGFENTAFSASEARTNLGIPWSALTNTSATAFQTALFGTNTNPVLVNTNGEVISPTNFWQVSPANTRVQTSQPQINATNTATNARNLYFYSLAISTTGVTNTVQLPTNSATLVGDVATVIHTGPTSSFTAVRSEGAGTNLTTLNQVREAVRFVYDSSGWRFADNMYYGEPVSFSGTNATANAASSRTNLGLPLAALTNTSNDAMMRALSGSTNVSHPYSGSISVVGTNNTNTLVFSNGILQSVQ